MTIHRQIVMFKYRLCMTKVCESVFKFQLNSILEKNISLKGITHGVFYKCYNYALSSEMTPVAWYRCQVSQAS